MSPSAPALRLAVHPAIPRAAAPPPVRCAPVVVGILCPGAARLRVRLARPVRLSS